MTGSRKPIGSDLAKVDAYVNTEADYHELPEVTAEDFARGLIEVNGAPRLSSTAAGRETITLSLDADVLDAFRATGEGWRSRINAALKESLERGVLAKR